MSPCTVTTLIGIPASGKTTWAIAQCAKDPNIVRINKDTLRLELLAGKPWTPELESTVILPERDRRIEDALRAGHDVIVDDTNLTRRHQDRIKELAKRHGALCLQKYFDISVEEAICRDAAREGTAHVGEAVIRAMASKYVHPPIVAYAAAEGLPWAVLCDIDGTAALMGPRSPYDASRADELDSPNLVVRRILRATCVGGGWGDRCPACGSGELRDKGSFDKCMDCGKRIPGNEARRAKYYPAPGGELLIDAVIYVSGREARYRDQTIKFLAKHEFPGGTLLMRATGDKRPDYVAKGEIFDAAIRGKFNIRFVLDDRDQVVEMWRKLGLTCLQVAEGKF